MNLNSTSKHHRAHALTHTHTHTNTHTHDLLQDHYMMYVLNTTNYTLTEDIFKTYIEVVECFLEDVSPTLVVNSLQAVFRNFNDTDLLLNSINLEVYKV